MKTSATAWEEVDVAADEAGRRVKQLQADHPGHPLFVRRDDGALLIKVPADAEPNDCLEQLRGNSATFTIFYQDFSDGTVARPNRYPTKSQASQQAGVHY